MSTEMANKLIHLETGYILYSEITKLPYIGTNEENGKDVVYMFDELEKIQQAVEKLGKNKVHAVMVQLNSEISEDANGKKIIKSQIRDHLVRLYVIGVEEVAYNSGDSTFVFDLCDLIPQQVKDRLEIDEVSVSPVQLAGMKLAQVLKSTFSTEAKVKAVSLEFYNKLAKSDVFIPVIPKEDEANSPKADLAQCKLPITPLKRADGSGKDDFISIFTSMDEVASFCSNTKTKLGITKLPFEQVTKVVSGDIAGVVVNPKTVCLPIYKDMFPTILETMGDNK